MDTSAEQIIDAKIKTINTKENSDDMLYPVVTKLKIITNAAIPTPLKNAFHKWLTHFYFQLSLTFIADLLVVCLIKWICSFLDNAYIMIFRDLSSH